MGTFGNIRHNEEHEISSTMLNAFLHWNMPVQNPTCWIRSSLTYFNKTLFCTLNYLVSLSTKMIYNCSLLIINKFNKNNRKHWVLRRTLNRIFNILCFRGVIKYQRRKAFPNNLKNTNNFYYNYFKVYIILLVCRQRWSEIASNKSWANSVETLGSTWFLEKHETESPVHSIASVR